MNGFFTQDVSTAYDERNRGLAPVTAHLHFLCALILQHLPARAHILCAGVGTGAEILALAKVYPRWTFTGVDPSAPMLDVCRARLHAAGVLDRCTLLQGYVGDVAADGAFDAALSLLVAHFIARDDRAAFYRAIRQRLKSNGLFISAEISCDLDAPTFPPLLENWGAVQRLMGAGPEALQKLPALLRDTLSVLSPDETEALLREGGFALPVRFFQSLMICGWICRNSP